jgi:hypothetical protein
MDPASIATISAGVLAALLPYLPKVAEKAAEKVGEGIPAAVGKLWQAVRGRMEGKETSKEALNDLTAEPESAELQTVFKVQLKKLMAQDEAFAKELLQLTEEIAPQGDAYRAVLHGDGAVAQGTGARAVGAGGVLIGGNADGNVIITSDDNKAGPQKKV